MGWNDDISIMQWEASERPAVSCSAWLDLLVSLKGFRNAFCQLFHLLHVLHVALSFFSKNLRCGRISLPTKQEIEDAEEKKNRQETQQCVGDLVILRRGGDQAGQKKDGHRIGGKIGLTRIGPKYSAICSQKGNNPA